MSFRLDLEVKSNNLVSEIKFMFVWGLNSTDNLHDSSLPVSCWPASISDDDCVWLLVECNEIQFTVFFALKMSWSNGNFDLSTWCKTDEGTEWEFVDDMSLESSLIFLKDEWNLEAQSFMSFP